MDYPYGFSRLLTLVLIINYKTVNGVDCQRNLAIGVVTICALLAGLSKAFWIEYFYALVESDIINI